MKKFIIIACMVIVGTTGAFAQAGKRALGVHLNYGTEIESMGLGIKYQYNITNPIRLEPSFDYFFKHDSMNMFDFNLNVHYLFPAGQSVQIYPLVGFTYTKWHEGLGGGLSWNKSKFGINLGAGADFALNDDWSLNFEVKYQLISDFDQAVFRLGIAYNF